MRLWFTALWLRPKRQIGSYFTPVTRLPLHLLYWKACLNSRNTVSNVFRRKTKLPLWEWLSSELCGDLSVCATSGQDVPESEFIGLASITELPLIICNVQRGGPSTGLPTKTEQSDLLRLCSLAMAIVRFGLGRPFPFGLFRLCFGSRPHRNYPHDPGNPA